ncbi:MAG: DUF6265 family protein [Planctomycetota bacterium]
MKTPNRPSLRRVLWPSAVLLAALLPLSSAVEVTPQEADAPAKTEKLTLDDITWLAGHWQVKDRDSMTEELWMPARGRVMLGLNRSVRGKAHGQFEFLRIVQTKKDTYYWASPGGSPATPFKMTEATEDHVVFENPEHDFPKRIEYRLDGDELTAQIFGDEPGPSWTLKRIGDVK